MRVSFVISAITRTNNDSRRHKTQIAIKTTTDQTINSLFTWLHVRAPFPGFPAVVKVIFRIGLIPKTCLRRVAARHRVRTKQPARELPTDKRPSATSARYHHIRRPRHQRLRRFASMFDLGRFTLKFSLFL